MSSEFIFGFLNGIFVGVLLGIFLFRFLIKSQTAKIETRLEGKFELMAAKIAGEVLDDKAQALNTMQSHSLELILAPLKEKLRDFERKVEETYSAERAERGSLRGELGKLMELNSKMSTEAHNLSTALRGSIKTQGNWGEMILENILERSGLRKGLEYQSQGIDLDLKNDEGQIIRPDIIVNLPEGKHVIVDSKVSLLSYESYCSSEETEEQEKWAKIFIDSLKKHIDGLAIKKYSSAEKLTTPDFVLLFMPLEPAFALAFRVRPEIFQYAWERNIALVSPTTLLTSLRTVAAIWKQENRKKNAEEIAARGGLLYDKFAGLVEDLQEVGTKLEGAHRAHEMVIRKLSVGSGNLIGQVEKLRELGAKSTKTMPMISEQSQ